MTSTTPAGAAPPTVASAAASDQRACFLLQVRPDRLDAYLEAHENVWTELRDALTDAGWRRYSLFVRAEDGLVVGHVETDAPTTVADAMAAVGRTDVDARWQAAMAHYFTPDGGTPQLLPQYFYLS